VFHTPMAGGWRRRRLPLERQWSRWRALVCAGVISRLVWESEEGASSTAICCSSEQRKSRYLVVNRPKSLACSCAPTSGVSSCGRRRRASSTRAAWPARVNARLRRRRGSPRVGVGGQRWRRCRIDLGAVTNRVSPTYRFSIDLLVFLTYQTEEFGFFTYHGFVTFTTSSRIISRDYPNSVLG
jgi:hypothetical protein